MKNLFKVCKTNRAQKQQHKLNLEILKSNQVSFGTKSLRIQGPKVWNVLSFRINTLSANVTKWSNTLKQFVGNLPTNCLSVFDHFVGLALKGLNPKKIFRLLRK